MLRLANRHSHKPYHLLSAAHRRRLEKLERAARNEYECLQQKNLDIADAGADSNFVNEVRSMKYQVLQTLLNLFQIMIMQ
ncbi:hypothetical protein DMN91_006587 [Ooceraea biroi]|uniref:Uncharacterized protein n=1 Tax=Ooceraea biroi TaxID=2015173 RepID=A0A3L8DPI5_OOCBI|nr:hypothetical protein DMN91_006587 [Ooceraea biroi]